MTISDTATKYRYEGNGSTNTFAFSGKAFTAADLIVEIILRSTNALVETLTLTTHYSVIIATNGTASITVVAGKIPSALQDIQIRRSLAQTQTVSLPTGTVFPAKSVENAIDRAVGLIQDQEEAITRSLKFPATSSTTVATLPEPVDDAVLCFDGTTGLFKVGSTNTSLSAAATTAQISATAAAASASAASTSASAASTSASAASSSATAAAASAAGVNLPSIVATDTGSILQVNAAGTGYDKLTPGTAGKFLRSNGADAALSYEYTGSVLLSTQTASSSASISFTSGIDGTYKNYIILMSSVVFSANVPLNVTLSTDGGSSYLSTNYSYVNSSIVDSGATTTVTNAASTTIIRPSYVNTGATTGYSLSGEIVLVDPSNSSLYKHVRGSITNSDSTGVFGLSIFSGTYKGATTAINAIKFAPNSGNFTSGTFKLYGIL